LSTQLPNGDALHARHHRAIGALLSTRTIREAARVAGLHENTLRNYLRDEVFRSALQRASEQLLEEDLRNATQLRRKALAALEEVLAAPTRELLPDLVARAEAENRTPPTCGLSAGVKVHAALKLLTMTGLAEKREVVKRDEGAGNQEAARPDVSKTDAELRAELLLLEGRDDS